MSRVLGRSLLWRSGYRWFVVFAILVFVVLPNGAAPSAVSAQVEQSVDIAVALPASGDEAGYGQGVFQGIQLAIEEANASGGGPRINLVSYDDKSSDEGAKDVAGQIVASKAVLVLGPTFSTASLAAGPVYAKAGLTSLPPTATSDLITQNPTTFRVLFKNSDQGEMLATYLVRVLGQRRAAVIVVDNGYGRTLEEGFARTAKRLGIDADYHVFKTEQEAEQIARGIAADPSKPPIVFLTLDGDAERLLTTLRRLGVNGPFLGGDALGDEILSRRLVDLPEERAQPGFFTEGLYAIVPVILDSANAEILSFAQRFQARFGRDPVWQAVAGYDAANLAVATVRAVTSNGSESLDVAAQRAAVLNYLTALDSPAKALPGLLGPFWFDEAHGRQQAIRIGQFHRSRFESAPLQIVPVAVPDAEEIASGAVFDLGSGRYARLQRVVYTGIFLNEIPRLDLPRSSFNADFYLWLRFARDAGPDSADPTDLIFPNMISGSFDRTRPSEKREMPDGTEYWLWRVQGEFRNDFDFHLFPFDQQALSLSFFNTRAPMERIVYVLDKRSAQSAPKGPASTAKQGNVPAVQAASATLADETLSIASPSAFRNLTQWTPLGAHSRRENLVTDSSLGDPTRVGLDSYRELSGYLVTIGLQRRALATLAKSLLPLLVMTLIMYASLYFPAALVKEKVTVAITSALSGAVLLGAINSQFGSVGYTLAVEYVFYVFFCLSLLCIVAVLGAERLRAANRVAVASRAEFLTRIVYVLAIAATLLSTLFLLK